MFQLRTSASQLIGHVRRCGNQGMTLPVSARSYSVGEYNPYFAKYASKLKKLEEENPEEFLYRVKEAGRKHRKKIIVNADGTVPEDDGTLNSEGEYIFNVQYILNTQYEVLVTSILVANHTVNQKYYYGEKVISTLTNRICVFKGYEESS